MTSSPSPTHATEDAERALHVAATLLEIHDAHRAKPHLERAIAILDGIGRRRAAAEARVTLARALRGLGDPSVRAVLEDAGTIFEDLGAEAEVRAIDLELREIEAELEESPRSFHASSFPPPPVTS
jgi:hypothetical protein